MWLIIRDLSGYEIKVRGGGGEYNQDETFVTEITKISHMLNFTSQPGLKFDCIYMRFFSPPSTRGRI